MKKELKEQLRKQLVTSFSNYEGDMPNQYSPYWHNLANNIIDEALNKEKENDCNHDWLFVKEILHKFESDEDSSPDRLIDKTLVVCGSKYRCGKCDETKEVY